MEKDLIKFYDNITFLSKDLAKYEDEKGNYQIIPLGQLICNLTYNELDKGQLQQARFNMIVDKDQKFNIIDIITPSSKYERTKKESDRFVLESKKVAVSQVWIIQNGLKKTKSFNNKEEALKVLNEINDKILKQAEI